MSLKETKEKLEFRKRVFECKYKSTYKIENKNDMTCMHGIKVNKRSECNLLHDISILLNTVY